MVEIANEPDTPRALAAALAAELRQPLAAACNYVALARVRLGAMDDDSSSLEILEKAVREILRAGDLASRIRQILNSNSTDQEVR